jgi:surface antigen
VGARYGVSRGASLTFSSSAQGTGAAMKTLSGTITGARQGSSVGALFSEADRQAQARLLRVKKVLH